MSEKINFSLGPPKLEEAVLYKIAFTLWDSSSLSSKLMCQYDCNDDWLKEIRALVDDKLKDLLLPTQFKEKICMFLNDVELNITNWLMLMDFELGLEFDSISIKSFNNILKRSPNGTIDCKKVAEILIQDEDIEIDKRYRIACLFCLEESIRILWERMESGFFYGKNLRCIREGDENNLTLFWSYKMKGESYMSIFELFSSDVANKNITATKFLWAGLSEQEKDQVLTSINEIKQFQYNTEVICFLLSCMSSEKQRKVLRINPVFLLDKFVKHPWRHLFFSTLNITYDDINEKPFSKIIDSVEEYSPEYFSRRFWCQIPPSHVKYFYTDYHCMRCLPALLEIDRLDILKDILSGADEAQLKTILSVIFDQVLYEDKLECLKCVIEHCVTSINTWYNLRDSLKEVFNNCKTITVSLLEEKPKVLKGKWKSFCISLDNYFSA